MNYYYYYFFIYIFFQKETDLVRIKTKMVDDQTETIRKLKEVIFVFVINSADTCEFCFCLLFLFLLFQLFFFSFQSCLSVSLSPVCLSVCLPACLPACLSVCLCLSLTLSLSHLLGQIPKFQPFFLYLSVRQKNFRGWSEVGVGGGGGVISKSLNRIYETLSYNPNKLIQPSEQALHSKQAGTSDERE